MARRTASLVALIAILAACSAAVSPPPSVSPSASALLPSTSPSGEATPSGSVPTPLPPADATPRPDQLPYLPPQSRAKVVSATVNVREAPSLDAPILGTLTAGDEVYVWGNFDVFGPVGNSGYVWYPVETDTLRGWAAKGQSGSVFYLDRMPVACPGASDLTSLLRVSAWELVSCLASDEIKVTGVTEIACQGGAREATYEPSWLASWCTHWVLTDRERADGPRTGLLNLAFPPDTSIPDDLVNGSVVEVTGHFDDPAAASCAIEPQTELQGSDAALWVLCREQFVVTDIKVVGDIGLPSGA